MPVAAEKTNTYRVWVHDARLVLYIVDAESEEEAQRLVESSEDADADFGGTTKYGEWYVDHFEEAPHAE